MKPDELRAVVQWRDRSGRELVVLGGLGESFNSIAQAIRERHGDDCVHVELRAAPCTRCGQVFTPKGNAKRCEHCRRRHLRDPATPHATSAADIDTDARDDEGLEQ